MEEEKEIKVINSEYKSKEALVELLLDNQFRSEEICKSLNISKNNLRSILKQKQLGKDISFPQKLYSLKLTQQMSDVLKHFLQQPENKSTNLKEMKQYICSNCDLSQGEISTSSVRELLKYLGYSYKKNYHTLRTKKYCANYKFKVYGCSKIYSIFS